MRHALSLAVSGLLLLLTFPGIALSADVTQDLVRNGDFKQIRDGTLDGWSAYGNTQKVTQALTAEKEGDTSFAKLTCTRCEGSGGDSHAMVAQVGGANVEKGKIYEFSCRARAENLSSRSVTVALQDTKVWDTAGLRMDLALGKGWREFRRIFTATRTVNGTNRLQFWFNEPGTFCVTAVRIVELPQTAITFTDLVPPGDSRNLIPDGSFELGAGAWASLGQNVGWGNLARLHGRVETGAASHGQSFLRIPLGETDTPVLGFDYYQAVLRRELRPLAAHRGWIAVEQGQPYTLSCDLRASVDGTPAVLAIRTRDPARHPWENTRDLYQSVTLTREWKRYTFTFRPEFPYAFAAVGPSLEKESRVDVDVDAVQVEKGAQATAFVPRRAVEVCVEPNAAGGLFIRGEKASLRLSALNSGDAEATVRFTFSAKDFCDRPVPLEPVSIPLPAGKAATKEWPLPPDWQGFYRLTVTPEQGGAGETRSLKLAVLPRRTSDDSVMGINHAFPDPHLIRLAKLAGVTWYRDWTLRWQQLEPKEGEYRWETGDAQVNRVVKEGAHLMALLPPFPSARWNSEAPAGLPTTGYPGVRLLESWAPKEPARLTEFTAKVVTRYKDRVKVWEFLNEPVHTDYALPSKSRAQSYKGKGYTAADYVALLKPAAEGMRRSDPSCKIMAGMSYGPETLSLEAIQTGSLQNADLFNLHIYPGGRRPESYLQPMDELLATMDRNGGRKPIWITEFSYYAEDDLPRKPFFPAPNSWAEDRFLANERECAEYTVRFFTVMLARGVEKIFIHSGASGSANQANPECCLFEYGGVPQKVLPAMAVFTELFGPSPRFVGEKRCGSEGFAMAFETDAHSMVVLWSADEGVLKPVAVPESARVMDLMGHALKETTVRPGTSPMYLIGAAGEGKKILESVLLATE
jgi:hypothetical protein